MTNYPGIHILNSLAGAASAAQRQDAEVDDPDMVMTSEAMAKSVFANPVSFEITDVTEINSPCCPLSEVTGQLQDILGTLSSLGKRPPQITELMRTLYGFLDQIDHTASEIELSLTNELASLQLQTIEEFTDRRRLISDVLSLCEAKSLQAGANCDEAINELDIDGLLAGGQFVEAELNSDPAIAAAFQLLVEQKQPLTKRFRQIQKQKTHNACHGIVERKEIAEALKNCGLTGLAKRMRQEAALREMGVRQDRF